MSVIAYVAERYFHLNRNINVIIDDARHYIRTTKKKYNVIIFDVYKGDIVPNHVFSKECFLQAKAKLVSNGYIIINFNGFLEGRKGRAARALYNTLKHAGFFVNILPTIGEKYSNNIFIACINKKTNFSEDNRVKLIIKGQNISDITKLFVSQKEIVSFGTDIFTDDIPKLEMWNIYAAREWRVAYNKIYTEMFTTKGISLFK